MIVQRIQTHEEKVNFLTRFLNGSLEDYPRDTPLMIYGSGGSGKSYVLNEVVEKAPVHIVVLGYSTPGFRFYPSNYPSNTLAVLFIALGTPEEFEFAKFMNAKLVEFVKDPNYM
jgi:hypothetical protein